MMTDFPWLTLLFLFPLVAAVPIPWLPDRVGKMVRWYALGVALSEFTLIAYSFWRFYDPQSPDLQLVESYSWLPQLGMHWSLAVDGLSLPLVLLSALVTTLAILASWQVNRKPRLYFFLLLVIYSAQVGVFLAQDLLLFFLMWELELVPAYRTLAKIFCGIIRSFTFNQSSMKYWQAIKLSSREFKRLTGVKRQTFRLMVRLVKAEAKKKKKVGRRAKLIIEDQILVTLQYWREYRSYFHISKDWKIAECTVCRIVRKIENILIQSRKFSLPGKKKLLDSSGNEKLILMDVMESPIERPKKHQKRFYSGKQGEHTLKTQVVLGEKTGSIICLAHEKGKTHDFKLFKKSNVKFHKLLQVIADKGYQGIAKLHGNSETPIKKPRGGKLTKEQKQYNRQLNRLRIAIEHINRRLKIFKILSYRYRNRHRRFGLRANLIAGIYDAKLVL